MAKEFTIAFSPLGLDTPANCVIVWPWEHAPDRVKLLSEHGGDEDGAVWIPRQVRAPYWLENLWERFGEPDRYQFSDGTLVIWAHA